MNGFKELAKMLGVEEAVSKIVSEREQKNSEKKTREEELKKFQVYKMINFVLPDFKVFSPKVKDLKEAVNYFKTNHSVEYPGCNILQTEGINAKFGPNFMAHVVWATPEEAENFNNKYGYIPAKWNILTTKEQNEIIEQEWEKERRKSFMQ